MKKVLYILQGLGYGGVPGVLLNYYREIKDEVEAHWIVKDTSDLDSDFAKELRNYGCTIYPVTSFNRNMFQYSKEVRDIIKREKYDVIHDNNKYFAFLSLFHARKNQIPVRICHVHNTVAKEEKNFIHRWFIKITSYLSAKYATHLLACSEEAGKSMFGKREFEVLNNAIAVEEYAFSDQLRQKYRCELNLESDFVLMTVGRYNPLKRYDFAMKVFSELKKVKKNAKYVIIGVSKDELEGVEKDAFDSLDDDTKDNILFLGTRGDIKNLLNAADVFLLASEHEGFGMVVVEAQANGLPCVVSTGLPVSVKQTQLVTFSSLEDAPSVWASKILNGEIKVDRKSGSDLMQESEFSIQKCAVKLKEFYGCE
ncbi:MAG: glycosyltransferase [Agathobacter sp.]|nr:glycosyltransferase [Agathobacter sp.]